MTSSIPAAGGPADDLDTEAGEMMLALDALWVGDAANPTPDSPVE